MFDREKFIKVEKGFNPTTFYCDKCHKSLEEELLTYKYMERVREYLNKKIDEVSKNQDEINNRDSGYSIEEIKYISGQLNILTEISNLINQPSV